MEINLKEKVNKPTIIEGFPGFGLIGTIATEFLIEHLDSKLIGSFWFEEIMPSLAIHEGKMIHPVGIYYNKQYNLIIIHSISATPGIEWKAAEMIIKIGEKVNAKEIISIEGVNAGDTQSEESRVFFHTNDIPTEEKLRKLEMRELKEGIIVGVTSALLMKTKRKTTCFFTETHSALPDSKAAAKVIEVLDKYLSMKLDVKPLLDQAVRLEGKLNEIITKNRAAMEQKEKKQLSYVG